MQETMLEVKHTWANGIEYIMAFQCLACAQVTQAHAAGTNGHTTPLHLLPMSDCKEDTVPCQFTDQLIPTDLYWIKFTPPGKLADFYYHLTP